MARGGGVEIFLAPLNKTCPEVMHQSVTWDGHDTEGLSLKLTITPQVHREEPRSRLLGRWIGHFKARPIHAEIASRPFTDENEHYWTNHFRKIAAPPWQPGQ
jgi:hypothetical protein